jgi:predicted nucleic acid-binding protein
LTKKPLPHRIKIWILTLKIEGEAYGKGVGENDLLIIANAKRQGAVLVTNEAKQADLGKTTSDITKFSCST